MVLASPLLEIVAMHKTWIEVALNGPWSRSRQPGIPDTVGAIVQKGSPVQLLAQAFFMCTPMTGAGRRQSRVARAPCSFLAARYSDTFAYRFPPKPYALAAHLALLRPARHG